MKKTLNESTVRRFMKLARIDGLTENFVTSAVDEDVDNTYEENLGVEEDDLLDLETDDEVLDLEGEAALDLDPDTVETIVDAVVTAIGDVTGTDTTVSSSAGAVDDLEDEAEDVFDGEQAVDLEDTIDDEDEGLDALEETDGDDWGSKKHEFKRDTVGGVKTKAGTKDGHFKDDEKNESLNEEDAILAEITKRVAERLMSLTEEE